MTGSPGRFWLAGLSLALVLLAGLAALRPSPAVEAPPLPAAPRVVSDFVPRLSFAVTGDVLGPGVEWRDLARPELAHTADGRVAGLQLAGLLEPALRLGLREGDLVWAVDGRRVEERFPSLTRALPRDGSQWCYQVLRDGAPLELCYDWPEEAQPTTARPHRHTGLSVRHRSSREQQPLADWLLGSNGDLLLRLDEIALDSTQGLARAEEAVRTRPSVCARGLCDGSPFARCFDLVP